MESPLRLVQTVLRVRTRVPGRLWIGERMDFLIIATEDFLKMAAAEKLAIKMGGVEFELTGEARESLRKFALALEL